MRGTAMGTVPSAWVKNVEERTAQLERQAHLQQLDHDILNQGHMPNIQTEVAVAAWSRKALHKVRNKELHARWKEEEEWAPGVALALSVAQQYAATAGMTKNGYEKADEASSNQHLLSNALDACLHGHPVAFGPQRAAATALLGSMKLRAVADQVLQHPGSFPLCIPDSQPENCARETLNQQHSSGACAQDPNVPSILVQLDLSATVHSLLHHNMAVQAAEPTADRPAVPTAGIQPLRAAGSEEATMGSKLGMQPAAGDGQLGENSSIKHSAVLDRLTRLQPSDQQLKILLQQSQQLRAHANGLGV